MMKKLVLFTFLLFSFFAFGQKVKMKNGIVMIDSKEFIKYKNCGSMQSECSILNNQGEEIIFMKTVGEAYGKNYDHIEIIFPNTQDSVEYRQYGHFKKIIELLIENKVILENKIDNEKIKNFILKYDEKTIKLNYNN